MEKKSTYYASLIVKKIVELFDSNSENFISDNELREDDNFAQFIHALANLAPTHIFNELSSKDKDILAFNHFANELVIRYGEMVVAKKSNYSQK